MSNPVSEQAGFRPDTTFWTLSAALVLVTVVFAAVPAGFNWQPVGLSDESSTNPLLRRVQWLPIWGLSAWMIWRRRGLLIPLLLHINPFLVGFCIWAAASVVWAEAASGTINRMVQLVGSIMICVACCVASWGRYRLERIMLTALTGLLVVSLIMVVALPRYAIHNDPTLRGLWAGAMSSKNELGIVFSLGLMFGTFAYFTRLITLRHFVCLLALIAVISLGASSTTATVTGVMAATIVWLSIRPPIDPDGNALVVVLFVLLLIGLPYLAATLLSGPPTVVDILGPVTEALGKDISLTGRDDIWSRVLIEARQHPVMGAGYGSFWLGPGGPSEWIHEELYWIPYQAHNGYIDIFNELGAVGIALVVGFVLWHLKQVGQLWWVDRPTAALHLALLVYTLVSNVTESTLFRPLTLPCTLILFSSLTLSRAQLQRRFDQAAQAAAR